jgi:hypothetical protein
MAPLQPYASNSYNLNGRCTPRNNFGAGYGVGSPFMGGFGAESSFNTKYDLNYFGGGTVNFSSPYGVSNFQETTCFSENTCAARPKTRNLPSSSEFGNRRSCSPIGFASRDIFSTSGGMRNYGSQGNRKESYKVCNTCGTIQMTCQSENDRRRPSNISSPKPDDTFSCKVPAVCRALQKGNKFSLCSPRN